MKKFITISLAIFEFLFYTVLMVLEGSIEIHNEALKLVLYFICLIIISIILYFLMKLILKKIGWDVKKYLYLVPACNLLLGLIFPVVLIVLIPNEFLTSLAIIVLVGTIYYGLFVNAFLVIINAIFIK